jgi:hypothetical protein
MRERKKRKEKLSDEIAPPFPSWHAATMQTKMIFTVAQNVSERPRKN